MKEESRIGSRLRLCVRGMIVSALVALVSPAAQAVEVIPENVELGMLQLDLVNQASNRILVCPPGLAPKGDECASSVRGPQVTAAPITPHAYLKLACPEHVSILSVSLSNIANLMGQTITRGFPQTVTLVTWGVCDPSKTNPPSK
ncbi:TPA: hypothetical protein ACKQHR_001387 [Pseudomonas aeruginosa]|nr:hypothetical protein [Pseudomonas aeruginosa]